MKEQPISTKSTDYATIKLTCRPNLLNSRPQRIGFYSKLEILACIQWLTDFKLGAQVSKIHDRISITHALVFIIFSGCATLPIGLANHVKLVRDVAVGDFVTAADVALAEKLQAVRVRREMEAQTQDSAEVADTA